MRPQAVALLLALAPAEALASGSISCSSADGEASVRLTIGSLPVLKVVQASVSAGGQEWHTEASGEQALAVGQAFRDEEMTRVDFTDANVEHIVAKLRVFHADEGRAAATAGTVWVAGKGAWAVDCVGP